MMSVSPPDYRTIEDNLHLIDQTNRDRCLRLLTDNRELFETARGSTHNHQTWVGGYIDHITDGLNYARHLYLLDSSFGRPLPFSLSDALLIFFLHDLEKPWRIKIDENNRAYNLSTLASKSEHKRFREKKLIEYGIELTDAQLNALTYVEGELTAYSSERRVMNELAAFCHKVDVWCARGWYAYPKATGDEWPGADRVRTNGEPNGQS